MVDQIRPITVGRRIEILAALPTPVTTTGASIFFRRRQASELEACKGCVPSLKVTLTSVGGARSQFFGRSRCANLRMRSFPDSYFWIAVK